MFQVLKEQVDLASVVASYTDLAPCGEALKGRCPHPDHDDENPSFYVFPDQRFHCFGCRWHGDVVALWAGVHALNPGLEAATNLAREYDIDLPEIDPEERRKAEERRILEGGYLKQAEEAHDRLSRHPEVAEWWQRRGFDEELQAQFLLGASDGGSAATIPFWHRGQVKGIIRRNLKLTPKYRLPKAEEFPQGYRPLFIPGTAYGEVFLVEGYVCALAAAALGLDAIAVGGTGISQRQMEELERLPGPIYIVRDNDEEGEKAARKWVEDLYPKAWLCPPIPSMEEVE